MWNDSKIQRKTWLEYIYKSELHKTCFACDATCSDSKYLAISDI